MALPFQNLYETYQQHTGDSSTANTTIGKSRINDTYKSLMAAHDWYFAEKTQTFTTSAVDYTYDLPFDYGRLVGVTIQISGIFYTLTEVSSHDEWQKIQRYRSTYTSNIPELYHITGDSMEIYPIPSDNGDADNGTFYYVRRVADMQFDNYAIGTVTLANGSTVVTGSGTTFTAGMVGRFIKGNNDGRYYELATFSSTTVMGLKKAFQGIAGASLSYTIGELPQIPEDYHPLLWQEPVATYWAMKKEPTQSQYYQALYDRGKQQFMENYDKRTRSQLMKPPGGNRFGVPQTAVGTWQDEDWGY